LAKANKRLCGIVPFFGVLLGCRILGQKKNKFSCFASVSHIAARRLKENSFMRTGLARPHALKPQGYHKEQIRKLEFQGRLDILLEMRISGVAGQGNTMLYGKSRFNTFRKEPQGLSAMRLSGQVKQL